MDSHVFSPEVWWDLRGHADDDERRRVALQQELDREVGAEHPLRHRSPNVVAQFLPQDEVAAVLDDGQVVVVHLTYAICEAYPARYPRCTIISSPDELEDE